MTYYMKAFDGATGAALAFVPEFQDLEPSFEFSDVGSIGFSYYQSGVNFSSLLGNRVEVGIFKDGVEMDDARYTLQTREYDEIKPEEAVQFVGVSLLNRLKKALVYSGDGSLTQGLDQVFSSATPGGIMKALFDQNYARGTSTVMRSITYASFTNTTDSNGDPWDFTIPGPLTYTVGVNYLEVLRHLVNSGMVEVRMVGRDLRLYNPGTMGVDRTLLSTPVVFRKGRDLAEAPIRETNESIAAVALIAGDEGILRQEVDPSVEAAWGRDEIFISQGGIKDNTTLGILAQQQLALSSGLRREMTHQIIPAASPWIPYDDYRTSDYVWTDRGAGPERVRIRQMVVSLTPTAATAVSVVLNDKFLERDIVTARKIEGILGGATATGSVAVPTDPAITDTTIPKAPASLGATSEVYVNGLIDKTVTRVALSWPAVTQNTDNSTITDLDHYETQYKWDEEFTLHSPINIAPGRDLESYTRRFDRRGKGFGWLGGDGGSSTRASSGRDFWAFADTNLGVADQEGRITSSWRFPHNTLVLTQDSDPTIFDAKWGYGNKMTRNDAICESTVGNWVNVSNGTVVRGTTTGYYGTGYCLQITSIAPGDVTVSMAAGASLYMATVPGRSYSVMMRGRSVGTARQPALGIRWYDASNNLLSTSTSANFTGTNSTWARYVHTAVAPANAVKASMVIYVRAAGTSNVYNADCMMLCEGDARYFGWNDPARNFLGGECAVMHPEELGAATPFSDLNDIFWTDDCVTVSGKILVAYHRYTTTGTFKNETYVAQFDGTTHQFESITTWATSDTMLWWTAAESDATYLYVYGCDRTLGGGNHGIHVMRVPIGNVLAGTKEYYTGTGTTWSTTRSATGAIYTGYSAQFGGVTQIGSTWYAVITEYGGSTMKYLTAPQAWGAWTMQGSFYTQPQMGGGLVAYFPRIHRQLESNAGIPMSYSVNGTVNGDDSLDNIRYYAPKFLIGPPANIVPVEPATDWSESRVIPSGTLVDLIGSIPPGANFRARVRAADNSGHFSAWTLSNSIRTSLDTVAPNRPSVPIVSSQFQGIRIEWDGTDFQGGPPPGDWSYLEVHVSEVANFQPGPPTRVDIIKTRDGGVFPYQGLIYGRTYYVRFISVDNKGNRSDPSDAASAAPEQLVNVNEIADKLIAGAKIADGTIAVRSLTVAAFEDSITPNGGFEEEATNANGTGTGQPYGWVDSGWTWGAGATTAYETTTPIGGTRSLRVTTAAAADGKIVRSIKFPVAENKLIALQAKVRCSRATANNNTLQIYLATGVTEADAGTFPGANSTWHSATAGSVAGTTAVQTIEGKAIVPAGHKWATVHIVNYSALDGSGYAAVWDDILVRVVGGSAFIADASILNAAIQNLAVDNAKIANVSVGKLTAGILSADMTVSARIKTADTGARVELNSSGMQAFNGTGDQTVDIKSSDGSATMTGRFRTGFTGARLEMFDTVDRTTINFYPTTGTNVAFINSPTDGGGRPRLGFNSGQFLYNGEQSRHFLFLDNDNGIFLRTYRTSDSTQNGFGLYLGDDTAAVQWHGASATAGGMMVLGTGSGELKFQSAGDDRGGRYYVDGTSLWYQVYASGGNLNVEVEHQDDGTIYYHRGRFPNHVDLGNEQAIICGNTSIGAGTSWTIGYGTAKVATPDVVCTPMFNAPTGWAITAKTTSSFTFQSVNTVAGDINFWAFRTN